MSLPDLLLVAALLLSIGLLIRAWQIRSWEWGLLALTLACWLFSQLAPVPVRVG